MQGKNLTGECGLIAPGVVALTAARRSREEVEYAHLKDERRILHTRVKVNFCHGVVCKQEERNMAHAGCGVHCDGGFLCPAG